MSNGAVESPSGVKGFADGPACPRDNPTWRHREAIAGSYEAEAWFVLGILRVEGQSLGILAPGGLYPGYGIDTRGIIALQ